MSRATLEVRDLWAGYGLGSVLKGVNMDLAAGEIRAILGSNGAGKSTLVKALIGLVKPSKGSVTLWARGGPISGWAPHQAISTGIALVPQGRGILARMTVEENLLLGACTARKDASRRLSLVYDQFPLLSPRRAQLGGTLSGGEQQVLAIARALMAEPQVLILDEPSLGLAPAVVRQVFSLIRDLRDKGLAVLIVEHNIRQSFSVAAWAYVLEYGQIVLSGRPAEIEANPDIRRAYLGI